MTSQAVIECSNVVGMVHNRLSPALELVKLESLDSSACLHARPANMSLMHTFCSHIHVASSCASSDALAYYNQLVTAQEAFLKKVLRPL